jgi:hypothetical protein
MLMTTKFPVGGPLYKLMSSFAEIFGKTTDPPKDEIDVSKENAGADQEKI